VLDTHRLLGDLGSSPDWLGAVLDTHRLLG